MKKQPNRKSLTGVVLEHATRDTWDPALPGFGVRVTPNKVRSYHVMYKVHGKLRRQSIGRVGSMTAIEAREKARVILDSARSGVDPRAVEEQRLGNTFAKVFEEYMADKTWRPRSVEGVRGRFNNELKVWHTRPVDSITKDEIKTLVKAKMKAVVQKGKKGVQANRLLTLIKAFFKWAVTEGHLKESPATHIAKPFKHEAPRERWLRDHELVAIISACDQLGTPFARLTLFLLATGQRRNEALLMNWKEVKGDVWTVPADRTGNKNKKDHEVTLNEIALSALGQRGIGLVFHTRTGNPVSSMFQHKAALDQLSGVTGWTLHDFRRTMVTQLAKMKIPPEVADKLLNHIVTGKLTSVGRIYQQHDYAEEQRAAIMLWGQHLARLMEQARRAA